MEVYVCYKVNDDGLKEEYFGDVKSLYSYKSCNGLIVHIVDNAEEGTIIFGVIKCEVY